MPNKVEEKVLAFVREHGDDQGAEVTTMETACSVEFGASAAEVREALFALCARGLISLRKVQAHSVLAKQILSGKERAARYRSKMNRQGRKQLTLWVTADEEAALRAALAKMRSGSK